MTPTPSPDREPSTVDATLDDVRHFYRLMMEGHPSGAALFDAAASDYMANLLDNEADQDERPPDPDAGPSAPAASPTPTGGGR